MTRRLLLLCAVLLAVAIDVPAQEGINLTVPVAQPTINNFVPQRLDIQVQPVPRITVEIVHLASGKTETFSYPCALPCAFATDAQVATLITNLNTANLTTRSLWRRTFDRLVIDFPARFPGGAVVQ
jgi:hypothetical protein